MRKYLITFSTIVALVAICLLTPASVMADETQAGPVAKLSASGTPPLLLDGTWVIIDEFMSEGAYFSGGPWTWESAVPVKFTITDLYVVSDQFEVYDIAVYVMTTPPMPDWDDLGFSNPFDSPPWTDKPDTALADGRFSSGVKYFMPGSHSIKIRDIHIPPLTAGGNPFPDGTVAFKAELSEVEIDIKPWSDPNSINTKSNGVVPVAILGSADFDVTTVDVTTIRFGPGAAEPAHDLADPDVYADHLKVYPDPETGWTANEDEYTDLVVHFHQKDTGLQAGDTEATLLFDTLSGVPMGGVDAVLVRK